MIMHSFEIVPIEVTHIARIVFSLGGYSSDLIVLPREKVLLFPFVLSIGEYHCYRLTRLLPVTIDNTYI